MGLQVIHVDRKGFRVATKQSTITNTIHLQRIFLFWFVFHWRFLLRDIDSQNLALSQVIVLITNGRQTLHDMMTSSNGNIFHVTGPLCGPGEFPTQRPVTRGFDAFFDLRLNKRLSKQPRGWWIETQSWSLWRHCNEPTHVDQMSWRHIAPQHFIASSPL